MKLSQKIRKILHDAFYKNASKERVEFALKCQDVTAAIDLHEKPSTLSGHFRHHLHLSLCQACKNYYDMSKFLSSTVKKSPKSLSASVDKINKSLLEKYSQNKKR